MAVRPRAAAGSSGLSEVFRMADRRSPLFNWLYDHHQEIAALKAGRHVSWEPLRLHLVALGINDATGKPPTVKRITRTWVAVRRATERNLNEDG